MFLAKPQYGTMRIARPRSDRPALDAMFAPKSGDETSEPVKVEPASAPPVNTAEPVFNSAGSQLFGLDAELELKRREKHDPEYEKNALRWVSEVTGDNIDLDDWSNSLKSGITLCKLANLAKPDAIKYDLRPIPLVERENIAKYLYFCGSWQFDSNSMFGISDLYEKKCLESVISNIYAMARLVERANGFKGPSLTVKPVQARSMVVRSAAPKRNVMDIWTNAVSKSQDLVKSEPIERKEIEKITLSDTSGESSPAGSTPSSPAPTSVALAAAKIAARVATAASGGSERGSGGSDRGSGGSLRGSNDLPQIPPRSASPKIDEPPKKKEEEKKKEETPVKPEKEEPSSDSEEEFQLPASIKFNRKMSAKFFNKPESPEQKVKYQLEKRKEELAAKLKAEQEEREKKEQKEQKEREQRAQERAARRALLVQTEKEKSDQEAKEKAAKQQKEEAEKKERKERKRQAQLEASDKAEKEKSMRRMEKEKRKEKERLKLEAERADAEARIKAALDAAAAASAAAAAAAASASEIKVTPAPSAAVPTPVPAVATTPSVSSLPSPIAIPESKSLILNGFVFLVLYIIINIIASPVAVSHIASSFVSSPASASTLQNLQSDCVINALLLLFVGHALLPLLQLPVRDAKEVRRAALVFAYTSAVRSVVIPWAPAALQSAWLAVFSLVAVAGAAYVAWIVWRNSRRAASVA